MTILSFGLLCVSVVNVYQVVCVFLSLLVLSKGYWIWSYNFLISVYLFTFHEAAITFSWLHKTHSNLFSYLSIVVVHLFFI